ncbi:MAG TPA: EAL domain-containing protein [Candidatus Competibacteraceae bacterium]|nr:EAL domain-containing protein [Candidatus Competibacteraceae bacterium]
MSVRRSWPTSGLLTALAAAIILVAAGAGWWLWNTLSRIEARLPVASLATERDFTVLLQDLRRLEQALELFQLQPDEERQAAARLALDFAILRVRDHHSLYSLQLGADFARLSEVLALALSTVESALNEAAGTASERLQAGYSALHAAIVQTKQLYDQVTQSAISQLSAQAGQLANFRNGLSLLLSFITTTAIGLVSLLLWQRHTLRRWHRAETRLQHLAHHDPLTGLPNRALFQSRLIQACAQAKQNKLLCALLYLDLDHFKDINDSLGHHAGDCLLQEVSRRLSRCVRASDTVARLGGDEFAIILVGLRHPQDASRVAMSIIEAIAEPVPFQGKVIQTSTSIGITLCPQDGDDFQQLLVNADLALYQAKARGRGLYDFFAKALRAQVEARQAIEQELRRALAQGEFVLHYQPQINLNSGALVGLEALLRWQHPQRGLLLPAEFLPVAEDSGLIVAIGQQVLYQACMQIQAWREAGLAPPRVAINLATAQFKQGDLTQEIRQALVEAGLDPCCLEMEITEGTILEQGSADIQHTLEQIQRMGVSIALDDFGTGYASLTHLKRFPVDRLKIDRSFIQHLGQDTDDDAIVRAVIQLGHSLGLEVVAEGIETEEQWRYLRLLGCDTGQGCLFGRPQPAAATASGVGLWGGLLSLDAAVAEQPLA